MKSVPVLFLVFNRLAPTKKVFAEIKKYKPRALFIASDGPRLGVKSDVLNCAAVTNYLINSIDWDCEVKTLFRQANLGCGKAVSEAITWFFQHVEEGIILEDDCLPNESFFSFCGELLEKYQYDTRISIISGNNFQQIQPMNLKADYYYSIFPSSWGWASWRRSWQGYDLYISDWNTVNQNKLLQFLFKERRFQLWWKHQFDLFYREKLEHTWDFQFHYHAMSRQQYSIIPKANLVSNIGHGPDATHFLNVDNALANLPTYKLSLPLQHPVSFIRNYAADLYIQNLLFGKADSVSIYRRAKSLLKNILCNG